MKAYTSFKEIEYHLKTLDLQRKIAGEEIKRQTLEVKRDMRFYHWLWGGFTLARKLAPLLLLRKIIK